MGKLKKILKKAGKAAAIGAALYGVTKLGKRRLSKAVSGTDDAGIGVSHFNHPLDYIKRKDYTTVSPDFNLLGAREGGRIGANKGGLIKGKPKLAKKGWK